MASQAQAGTEESKDPQSRSKRAPHKHQKELYPMVNWKYDLFLYVIGNLVDTFFREVVPRGSWRVPQTGPVLFVAAPHANQVSSPSSVPPRSCSSRNTNCVSLLS
jgi:glycerol-3-phosphate O-acyltransferase / dihydroxyacetone phosphate acyltransferase